MADAYERGLSCVTMSKPWGAGGATIGWLAFRDPTLRQRLLDAQYFGTACPSRASEIQALMVLRASDAILEKNLAIIRENVALVDAFVAKYADHFEWVWRQRPAAGTFSRDFGWETSLLGRSGPARARSASSSSRARSRPRSSATSSPARASP